MSEIKYVYVAGPYTKGDVGANVRAAIMAADRLVGLGYVPYVPHLSHFWHLICPHMYEYWMQLDADWLQKCDALLKLEGESKGADDEATLAKAMGKPVFASVAELVEKGG